MKNFLGMRPKFPSFPLSFHALHSYLFSPFSFLFYLVEFNYFYRLILFFIGLCYTKRRFSHVKIPVTIFNYSILLKIGKASPVYPFNLKGEAYVKEMVLRDFATELTGIACMLMIADGENDKDKAIGDVMEIYGKILVILKQIEKIPEEQSMITDTNEIIWSDFTTNFTS